MDCVCQKLLANVRSTRILRRRLGGFFGLTRGDLRLQDAVLGAAVNLLLANAVEARGVAA